MIKLTRLNNKIIIINSDLIQCIEETPDTVITLTNSVKYVVKETSENIIEKIINFRHKIYNIGIKKD